MLNETEVFELQRKELLEVVEESADGLIFDLRRESQQASDSLQSALSSMGKIEKVVEEKNRVRQEIEDNFSPASDFLDFYNSALLEI